MRRTMVSFMRCCNDSKPFLSLLLLAIASLLWALPAQFGQPAWAGQIEPKHAEITANDESYALSAEFAIDLGARLEDAVTRGVPLFFKVEVVLERPRKYWIAEHIASRELNYKLSYSSLTRKYRISSGVLNQFFDTLPEALRLLGQVGSLQVIDKGELKAGEIYQAAVRLSLDRSQLPKPFQLDAFTDKTWQVEAKTLRWTFTP